ncbi:MAG: ABC transporter ATP-binding protein [Gemmatimonadetes bacterium]|nr:ABC transporter ATP-binding protein [Gemmatimonadota bacterium]
MIVVRELAKHYGAVHAVDGLSFDVQPGEVLGLVGPNGAGKTTTLRALCGIIVPTRGLVEIGGHDIQRDPVPAKRALAFIPDEPHLFEYLTVEEHLRFIARLYGVADAESRMGPLLAELELSDKAMAMPRELSRGMKQKLAIACGLLHDPSVLVLDEPLTGLDPGGMRKMRATIAARARAGSAVVLSSHLLQLVEELCTKILVMRQGRAVAFGTIDSIIATRPEFAGRSLEDVFLTLTGDAAQQ